MPQRLTTEEFIQRARKTHGDKYDYSKVEYINKWAKVLIICPIHGEFWQCAREHVRGRDCPQCGIEKIRQSRQSNTGEWIAKARKVHGNKYDYSKSYYVACHTPLIITCPIHGDFAQTPSGHLSGRGCQKCGLESSAMRCRLNLSDFIGKSKKIHGDKYDYSKVEYKNNATPVCIICPEHGEFWQAPSAHMSGRQCPKCAINSIAIKNTKSTKKFISQSKALFGEGTFDYTPTVYTRAHDKVIIRCYKHGNFEIEANEHLKGSGCPLCSSSAGELAINQWLKAHNINCIRQFRIVPNQVLFGRNLFIIDFYLPDRNIFIEFHGQQHYKFIAYWHKTEDKLQEQQDRDHRLREYCKQHRIMLIEIPYTELKNIDNILTLKILKSKKK